MDVVHAAKATGETAKELLVRAAYVWLLLFWPVFGLLFSYAERFYPVAHYFEMHCALDDLIPFNEWFLIPYLFWFVYLIGAVAYTFFFDA